MTVFHYITIALYVVQTILWIYLAFGTIYIFIFSIGGLFRLRHKITSSEKINKIAVLIPGYKEDSVILEAAKDALKQHYPHESFNVIIIADSFQTGTLSELKKLPVNVIEVSFDISTKTKALNKAMENLPDQYYDVALVLDADNLMEPQFLQKINTAFNAGYQAIQGHRIAKNTNTSFAVLDAVSEEINNHIFRKGHRVLGLSSSLIGSGMAFNYNYFKDLMKGIKAVGGFDKEIELTMLGEGKRIEYLENAMVFDEKVQIPDVFVKQRRRWLSAQIHYSKYFFKALKSLISKGNIDFFDKSAQMLLPPRILLLGLLPLFTLLSLLFNPLNISILWGGLFLLCILALFFAIPTTFYNKSTLAAISTLPRGFFLMLVSLFSTKGANKRFIHTQHTTATDEEKKT
ncbi:MAG: glycosyltransferase family 2 protein [Bacteroidales bacterium]|nr:glycosyltransferase family 2 protein [Bacteroidales bacterium]